MAPQKRSWRGCGRRELKWSLRRPCKRRGSMFKRILLATDGSPVVEREVLFAGHLALVEQAEIIVLHAYQPPAQYTTYAGYDRLAEHYHAVAQTVVDDAVNELHADGVQARGELRRGS